MTWITTSPLVRGFLGALAAMLVVAAGYRLYQTDQLTRATVAYLNAQIARQQQMAQAAPILPAK